MTKPSICITGSSGLIGSAVAELYLKKGWSVVGIDNNMRQNFFGDEASTIQQGEVLSQKTGFVAFNADIRDHEKLDTIFSHHSFSAIVHCAAQPSHDKAKEIPLIDFEVNALATVQLLELTKKYCPSVPFIFTSTNKVYGDNPNKIALNEQESRFAPVDRKYHQGFSEDLSIDHTTHSLFGASKTSADIYVQEYGKYLKLKTSLLRLGCVTGKNHASVKAHGFLSYLVKSVVKNQAYEIIGYKGKQVRDQIDASDVAAAIEHLINHPNNGEVYNMGGGLANSASIIELIRSLEQKLRMSVSISYNNTPRQGDHIWYVSNTSKFQNHYPSWKIRKNLNTLIDELVKHELSQQKNSRS